MDSSYITSAQKADQLPDYTLPEIAFMGRSNCGKSSLLNALTARKGLARSSSTPGRTQMANFFSVSEKIIFADLPGYGFNVASKEIQKLWVSLLEKYIIRDNVKEFLFLMDSRRKIEEFELGFIKKLLKQTTVSVVLTKTDKLKKNQIKPKVDEITKILAEANLRVRTVIPISSLKKSGVTELRNHLFGYIEEKKSPEEK